MGSILKAWSLKVRPQGQPATHPRPTVHDARPIPGKLVSGLKDPEIAAWLKTGPAPGAHEPVHEQRREHDAFIDAEPPPVGRVEFLGSNGPLGTVTREVPRRSGPSLAAGARPHYEDVVRSPPHAPEAMPLKPCP